MCILNITSRRKDRTLLTIQNTTISVNRPAAFVNAEKAFLSTKFIYGYCVIPWTAVNHIFNEHLFCRKISIFASHNVGKVAFIPVFK